MMFGNIKLIIAAATALCLGFLAGDFLGAKRGEASGAAKALLQAETQFNQATGELSNEADRARVNRRYCVDGGGVYDFATGECAKGQGEH